ncbi:unnamed protein product [Cylindrotheca closterium]|uniref:Uncharacterized protein n=1 Tax=Cylindrotheca closterium TaxID=2856 RepID=A0AAD2FTJ5_9STRA|nr:unnamed protein product [Cylindrotheca closterium]
MNISDDSHTHSRRNEAKSTKDFNILNISNHHDKIVPKNMDFRNEFQFEGTADDMKALRGNILEMDSLHLAKKRHVPASDKERLNPAEGDCEEEVDDFEEDSELFEATTTTTIPLKRLSAQGKTKIHTISEEDKTKPTPKHDFRHRIEDSLCVDSIHLNKKRMEEQSS